LEEIKDERERIQNKSRDEKIMRRYKITTRWLDGNIEDIVEAKDISDAVNKLDDELDMGGELILIIEKTEIWNYREEKWEQNNPWWEEEKELYEWEKKPIERCGGNPSTSDMVKNHRCEK